MNIVESFLTENPCYRAGSKISVEGLMLHSVGCPQPKASAFINSWNSESYDRACVHAFIDGESGDVYQTLPWNHFGWHCGSGVNGSANRTHIGVEMCEPGCITYVGGATFECSDYDEARAVAERTYNSAVELFAYLCREYDLDPLADGVVISHSEGHERGIASSHSDPVHLWEQLDMGYTMDGFRNDVKAAMEDGTTGVSAGNADSGSGSAAKATGSDSVTEFPETPFTVKVIIDDLNYRSKASMDGAVRGQTGKGVFTIVEVSNGWGRLKSGAGWIWLENPSYCVVQETVAEEKQETCVLKSVDEVAKEVIRGEWGNGDERKEKLVAAGYEYAVVQRRVNELLK
jgi:hypothetical protein